MISTSDPIKRLLIRIKFLLEITLKPHLERDSDADSITAIILLDYCVESILKTVITAANINLTAKGDPKFQDLWDDIDKKVVADKHFGTAIERLPFRMELKNLHKQRNQTQHDSRTPSRIDVERDSLNVKEFARQIYQGIYGLDYQSLTLVDLVRNQRPRVQ